jgi:hypothetical protein
MDRLEQELKDALRRQDPPAGFADRVARRVAPQTAYPRWWAGAAAAVVLVGAGFGYRQYRGEMAKEQVMQAFKIAAVKVNRIQTQVRGVEK